jgi:hypothetical protein
MPGQLAELSEAMSSFEDLHAANMAAAQGEPDWALTADIRVAKALRVIVDAEFDLQMVVDAWESTQAGELESLVGGLMQAEMADDLEPSMLGQVMGQLQQGRAMAGVRSVEVLECRFAGAPANATETLKISPEAGIPLASHTGGLSFEFAPILTIRNQWEKADIPTFSPMGQEIVVPLERFEAQEPFSVKFVPAGQEYDVSIEMSFRLLD